jgi:hypothetical protein
MLMVSLTLSLHYNSPKSPIRLKLLHEICSINYQIFESGAIFYDEQYLLPGINKNNLF